MHVVTRGYLSVHCAVKDVRSIITFLRKTQTVGNNIRTSANKMYYYLSKQAHGQSFMMFVRFHNPLTGFVFEKQENPSSTENKCMVTNGYL